MQKTDQTSLTSAVLPHDILPQISTFMFDMDGTLLDLAFDNHFWQQLVPEAWGKMYQASTEQAKKQLYPLFKAHEGTLNWYSLPFWSEALGLDLIHLKQQHAAMVQLRPNVLATLDLLRSSGRPLWLVTNAHPVALGIKLQQSGIQPYFDLIVSSHELHSPKETPQFWEKLQARHSFEPARSLLVDDSLPVLAAAHAFGLQTLAINQPDSRMPPRENLPFTHITHLDELVRHPGPRHVL